MDRNYIYNDCVQVTLEHVDGEIVYLLGTPMFENGLLYMDMIRLYNDDELLRIDSHEHPIETAWLFFMVHSDIKPSVENGYLIFRKGANIIYMEPRWNIKGIKCGLSGTKEDTLFDIRDEW